MISQVFYVVHYPLVATSIGTVISYIYQWIHNRLLPPQGVTGNGTTNHSTCWATQSQRASSFSPWLGFLSILYSYLAGLAASRSSLTTNFPHDTWSLCHAWNPAPQSWLCNQRSLPIQRSITYAMLRCRIHTLCVSTDSIGMINLSKVRALPTTLALSLSTHWHYHEPSCSLVVCWHTSLTLTTFQSLIYVLALHQYQTLP